MAERFQKNREKDFEVIMREEKTIIRRTASVCPVCLTVIKAQVVESGGNVFLDKSCAKHGDFSLLLSRHPAYYKSLNDFYFPLMTKHLPQRDYIVHLTNRCDLNCPICLARANLRGVQDYPLERLKEFLKGKKGCKIDLMGAEPTMRDDLPEIIRIVKSTGNISALHTNGNRIADYDYLKSLKNAGLHEVHMQFDGFDERAYEIIRGKDVLAGKKTALDNLEKLNIATDLVVTIVRGVNEQQMKPVLDFAAGHPFVREVFFLGCRFLGKAKDMPIGQCLMPDELIDLLEEQSAGRISRANVLRFQKIYYALLSVFSVRKCFYIQHYLIARDTKGYVPLDRIFDLEGIEKEMERFKELKMKQSRLAALYLLSVLFSRLMRAPANFFRATGFLGFGLPFIRGFNLSRLPRKNILIGFISACDGYSLDYTVSRNCGKGTVSVEFGVQESGALDNVLRDGLSREGGV